MNSKEEEFQKRLLSTFKIEARDHLKTISAGLLEIERMESPEGHLETVETIFRASHNMKGAARAVNMRDIEAICQSLEDVFDMWKQEGINRSSEVFDLLYHSLDVIRMLLSPLDGKEITIEGNKISNLIERLSGIKTTRVYDTISFTSGESLLNKETILMSDEDVVRIPLARISSLLLQAEELLSVKLLSSQHSADIREVSDMFELFKNELKKVYHRDESFNRVEGHIKSMERRLLTIKKSVQQYNRSLNRMVDNLLDDTKMVMMSPFSTVLEGFPLLVRNISNEQGKAVDLIIQGGGIEADRRILEGIKDPLIHIVRNCIDHGIERPEGRISLKKAEKGTIKIIVSQLDNRKLEILITDDGMGIDINMVRASAVSAGIISQEDADSLSEYEAMSLIFHSGVSTTPVITDISGRGLGLAIVREKIEKLNGSVILESHLNKGSTFRIILPLTIATFRGITVSVSGHIFVIPLINVEQVIRVKRDDLKTVENKETITLDNRPLSFVWLSGVLELTNIKRKTEGSGFIPVLILNGLDKRIAFGVDEIMKEDEFFVKGLGRQLLRVRNIEGAALLGSGKPVPVLNVTDLIRSVLKGSYATPEVMASEEKGVKPGKGSILVVEDSITSRILLKNILESAGYSVKTAVDGIDAITTLKTGDFDLIVSDIEMPRMDGFDLTAKIRGDERLDELPVVLVTALEKREDRERGIEVGANAYIVKSSFDQGNLLEVIRRLI